MRLEDPSIRWDDEDNKKRGQQTAPALSPAKPAAHVKIQQDFQGAIKRTGQ